MEEMEQESDILVDRMFHIPGKINATDIATHQGVQVEQVMPGT